MKLVGRGRRVAARVRGRRRRRRRGEAYTKEKMENIYTSAPLRNNMFMVQPINKNFFRSIERVGLFVQVSNTPFKGTLIYLS